MAELCSNRNFKLIPSPPPRVFHLITVLALKSDRFLRRKPQRNLRGINANMAENDVQQKFWYRSDTRFIGSIVPEVNRLKQPIDRQSDSVETIA